MKLRTINFRIHEELKTQFEAACIANRTSMSAKLNHMIQDFVDEESRGPVVQATTCDCWSRPQG